MRELVLANVRYWIEEFHVDGYRLDATQQIFDASDDHILAALARVTRKAAAGRDTLIIGENETQHARLMRPAARGGYGLDALWNDDFHHAAVVALTGRAEAYYSDYRGSAQEFLACAKWGFLYQGQYYPWQKKGRGTPALDCRPAQFVTFIENHDQVANSARGERLRLLTSPGRYRAMTALLLLMPGTPMLFQGQEFGSTRPFLFFADHAGQLGKDVRKGRARVPRRSSRRSPTPGRRRCCTIPPIRMCSRDRRSITRNAIVPSTRRSSRFIAICCGCAARRRRFARRHRADSTAPC